MKVRHLPPAAVEFLNALNRGTVDDTVRASFQQLLQGALRWRAFHGAFTLHDAEAGKMARIAELWSEISADAGVDELTTRLYEAVGLMDEVVAGREKPHFSTQPAINDFLLAAVAVRIGRGEWRAVAERLPVVERYVAGIRAMIEGSAPRLVEGVRDDLAAGLRAVDASISAAGAAVQAEDVEALHRAFGALSGAAEVLQHFLDWEKRDNARIAELHRRFSIPLVGPTFEMCLVTARATPRRKWGLALSFIEDVLLPRLQRFWAQSRGKAAMPSDLREERLAAVDAGIMALRAAVAALPDEAVYRTAAIDGVEKALETLSTAFAAVQRDRFRRERLQGTAGEAWYDLLAGLLAGTVPDVAAAAAVKTEKAPLRCVDVPRLVREYLEGGDADRLLDALGALVAAAPEQPTVATWTCDPCGWVNPTGHVACTQCRTRPRLTCTVSWQG